jgi:hypothetical protein
MKHHIDCEFKISDIFIQSVLYLCFYIQFMGHKRKKFKMKLKLGISAQDI